jgi:hypothetical protein
MQPNTEFFEAALEYLRLKDGSLKPVGKSDHAGRFTLSTKYACCVGIRKPSHAYPLSEMAHARSATHVAHSRGISELDSLFRRYTNLMLKHPSLQSSQSVAASAVAEFECQKTMKLIDRVSRK